MDWLRLLVKLSVRRVQSSRGLLILVAISVFASVTLVAVSAIYSQTLAEAGLRHSIASIAKGSLQMRIVVHDRPIGGSDYQRLREVVEPVVAQQLGWLEDHEHRYGRSQAVLTANEKEDGIEVLGERAFFSFLTGFGEKTRLTEGRWPEATALQEGPQTVTVEALVGPDTAKRMGLQPGSTMLLLPYGAEYEERLKVQITGVVEPKDRGELYWLGDFTNFDLTSEGSNVVIPFFLTEEIFFDSVGATYPSLLGTYWWRVFLKTDRVTTGMVDQAIRGVAAVDTDINKVLPRSLVLTGLDATLEDFKRSLELAQVPLLLLTSLVVGVLLYFLVLVMNLVVRHRSREVALIRGRGAGIVQAAALLTLGEGLTVVVLAVGLGPVLAWSIVRTFLVGSLSTGGAESAASLVSLPPNVYLLAVIVGVVALAIFFFTGLGYARLHLADFLKERARPPGMPLVHRYYLDVLVLAVLGVVLWQVHARGGFVSERLLGGLQVDATLLLGPAIALLAAGLVLLRVLPAVLQALSWVSERLCPAWASLSLKRMARNPVAHGLLATVVMGPVALGTFAAGFEPTLSRSQHDQVYYSTGSDIVAQEPPGRRGEWDLAERLQSVSGVREVTAVSRSSPRLAAKGSEPSVTVLAVTPETLTETAWFRPDFSDEALSEVAEHIRTAPMDPGAEMTLPPEAESLGVWARLKQYESFFTSSANLWARVVDSQGKYDDVWLGEVFFRQEWQYMEAPLPEPGPYVQPPFRLVAMYLRVASMVGQTAGAMYLDDVTVKGSGLPSQGVVVEGFEEKRPWFPLPAMEEEMTTLAWESTAAHTGSTGLEFSWPRRTHDNPAGIILTGLPVRLNAVGGPGFSPGQEVILHAESCLVPVVIQGVVRYFPTIDPSRQPFLLLNLQDYDHYFKEQPGCGRVGPTEYWISHQEGADPAQVVSSVRQEMPSRITVQNRTAVMESVIQDPLRGGSRDITLLSLAVLAGAVLLGLTTYGATFFEQARVDLAVARTFGLLRRHLALGLALERVLIVALAAVAGWVIGAGLSRWALGYLAVTPAGKPVMPPMQPVTDAVLLIAVFASVAGATVVALLIGATQTATLDVPEVLRWEE